MIIIIIIITLVLIIKNIYYFKIIHVEYFTTLAVTKYIHRRNSVATIIYMELLKIYSVGEKKSMPKHVNNKFKTVDSLH